MYNPCIKLFPSQCTVAVHQGQALALNMQKGTIMLKWTSDPSTLDPIPGAFLGLLQMAIFC